VSGRKILVGTVIDPLMRRLTGLAASRVIRNYDEFCDGKPARRALLSYLVLPLLPPRALRDRVKFSNRGIAQEIPRVLNELGYSVDIVNFDNRSWLPDRHYDLFIGHGGINFEPISQRLPASAIRIYFATGIYWWEWNANNNRRAEEMVSRRGVTLSSYRAVEHEEEYALNNSDGIICLGNKAAVQTYARFPQVIGINNAVFPVDWDGWRGKDLEGGRKHFLFFSGPGNVHKGLDLLLEAFAGTDLHLHVCQHLEPDFADAYRQELTVHSNIHVYGFIPMRSQKFTDLATQCDWVISPTCAEGQPGAVLECMAHGLIPILSKEANIDIGTWGIPLPDCRIDTLRLTGLRASVMEMESIHRMTAEVVDVARNQYSAVNFYKNIRKAVGGLTLSFQRQ